MHVIIAIKDNLALMQSKKVKEHLLKSQILIKAMTMMKIAPAQVVIQVMILNSTVKSAPKAKTEYLKRYAVKKSTMILICQFL